MVSLQVICLIHMLSAGETHGLAFGKDHPVEYEAVVPVNDEPQTITDDESLNERLRSSKPYLKDQETFLRRCAPYRKPARRTA